MKEYNPQKIEKKWQKIWEKRNSFRARDFAKKPKKYVLVEFPYPSGEGLHVGHVRSYSALDAIVRKARMEGFNVLYPIGWDAFGLPTENYAIKMGIHPSVATKKNVSNFKRQLKSLGLSFDWSREINTTDPKYYKWTQWIFLKLYEKGLAYQAEVPINWCPRCRIGLANEEVVNGACERCGTKTRPKKMKQWMLKITEYTDRLIDDLSRVDYLEKIKTQQINWIGKSYGTEIDFKLENSSEIIKVFTTRADTVFGVTSIVVAPEHPLLNKIVAEEQKKEVAKYIVESHRETEFKRTHPEKEKSGVFSGAYCINPVNGERVSVWVGDYAVATYGGGAVMMVPAHDKRDYEFAKKYGLQIKEVVLGGDVANEAFVDYGTLINSGQFSGLDSEEAIKKMTAWLDEKGFGRKRVHYKLRDWVFSRQHYWGEPIPIIHCENCGAVLVPEKDLPVELPYVKKYEPTGTGESPLAAIQEWVDVSCPKCKGAAKRETDTMPNWAGSSWYFMRYMDPDNVKALADAKKLKYWLPVDLYNGGMEHTTLHLLYSRFWYKFLYDIGVAPTLEPYSKRTSHGMVLARDGRKMSKSFGNVINPDQIVNKYGADTLRIYEMFMGPFDQAIAWNDESVGGAHRFLERIWRLVQDCRNNKNSSPEVKKYLHKLSKKIDDNLAEMKFNTIVAACMEFLNFAQQNKKDIGKDSLERLLLLLAPFAPHIAEELWLILGRKTSIHQQKWPKYDQKLIASEKFILIVQINGKMRDKIEFSTNTSEAEVQERVLGEEKVQKWLAGKQVKKAIFVPGRLINFVV